MITFKGKEVTKDWILEQTRLGLLKHLDIKFIKVDSEPKPSKPKKPQPKPVKSYPFNYFIKSEDLKGRKLFGCVVRSRDEGLARVSLDTPIPCYEHFMVEIPIECAEMEEEKVVGIIRRTKRVQSRRQGNLGW